MRLMRIKGCVADFSDFYSSFRAMNLQQLGDTVSFLFLHPIHKYGLDMVNHEVFREKVQTLCFAVVIKMDIINIVY